jgi:hypothetical protein
MNFKSYLFFPFLTFFITIITFSAFAQASLQIPYQGVARDAQGNALQNQNITILLAIEDISGTELFSETHNTTTNQFGLFTVKIGSVTALPSNLWSNGDRFLHVKMDPAGGTSYTDLGSTQFLSVPYALYAETSNTPSPQGPAGPQGAQGPQGIQGEVGPQGSAGILSNGATAGNTPFWNGTQWVINNSNIYNNGAGIGIGTTSANTSAKLEIASTTQGFLPPRMTSAQRDAIITPIKGLTIYNTTVNCLQWWNGTMWYDGCTDNNLNQPYYPTESVFCGNTTSVIDVLNPITGKIWMDRNLGASQVALYSQDTSSYGDLYQWGRRSDGHQCRNSPTTDILSGLDMPTHGNFIITTATPYDWRIPQNSNLWQGVNGLNNPCPNGYRIPSAAELGEEHLSWISNNSAGAIASPLKWPLAGARYSSGSLGSVGSWGCYWSNSGNTNLDFSCGFAQLFGASQATGFSIRCIKEENIGNIGNLNCEEITTIGNLFCNQTANNVSVIIPYSEGNGGTFSGQSIASQEVTCLTATTSSGTFANGNGVIILNISGTPSVAGTAAFSITIGGQNCNFTIDVGTAPIVYPAGSVFCENATSVVDVTNPTTGKMWMDRNLGATQVATNSSDIYSFGDLYQWGRGIDGHQCRNSATTGILSSLDQPGHGNFILSLNADWRNPQNSNLWQGLNGVNNPCPSGYRLPSVAEFNAERISWVSNNSAGAFSSPLKLPLAGSRSHSNGLLGSGGNYWTSGVAGWSAVPLTFSNSNNGANVIIGLPRAYGFSVRCIKGNIGTIGYLNCAESVQSGSLTKNETAINVSMTVPYVQGNGVSYNAQSVSSSGVSGLTANLSAGTLSNCDGYVTYLISGTPSTAGIANFTISLGGQTCGFSIIVASGDYPYGSLFCSQICENNSYGATAIVDVTNPTTGKIWMDRNLGAIQTANSNTDQNAYGVLYQWGRRSDGHQCRGSNMTSEISFTDQPSFTAFILAPNSPYDWRNPQNANLWQGLNGINNPCPSGYRIPTEAEYDAERLSWISNNSAGAFASPLKWTVGGFRDNLGEIQNVGTHGNYWSSSVNGTNRRGLINFTSGSIWNDLKASYGLTIRCIKEPGTIGYLNCNENIQIGGLASNVPSDNVSVTITYSGGNGGNYIAQSIPSTGISGLTASLNNGSFAFGNGEVTYIISGTPSTAGTASFYVDLGGQSCSFSLNVAQYAEGSIFCTSGPTVVFEVNSPITGKIWMDRNLGATHVADSTTDQNAYGDLYQWGRRSDGHQCRNSLTTSALSSSDQPLHGNFIISPSFPNWRSPQNTNLWQGVNGINNPCPSGYRLPTNVELNAERLTWNTNNSNGAFNSPLKLTVAGNHYYSDGLLNNVGGVGYYWTSTFLAPGPMYLYIYYNSATLNDYGNAANGNSVRCIKDYPSTIGSLNCSGISQIGNLIINEIANNVIITVPYTGGNAGAYSAQSVSSTGVNGLTAALSPGFLTNGNGNVSYVITGTPLTAGMASFSITLGGQSCSFSILVNTPQPQYPANSVFCNGATFIQDVTNPNTGKIWMDRNLGATQVAASSIDQNAYGDLYQWGRRNDGHQCRSSASTSTLSSTDQPLHGNFILTTITPGDWRSPQNINLWQGVNGVNNPCPIGYRLPTETELNSERLSWTSYNSAGAFASPVKWTAAGGRSNTSGLLSDVNTIGKYWSSTAVNTSSRCLIFAGSSAGMNPCARAQGNSVRCLKN